MRYDVIAGNPPFGNLHLKIIDSAICHIDDGGTGCFIHPARWYEDPQAKYKRNSDLIKFKGIVEDIIQEAHKRCKFGVSLCLIADRTQFPDSIPESSACFCEILLQLLVFFGREGGELNRIAPIAITAVVRCAHAYVVGLPGCEIVDTDIGSF